MMKKTTKGTSPLTLAEERKILAQCLKVAKQAGAKLLQYQKRLSTLQVTYKEAQGVASTADVAAEKIIVKALKSAYPHHLFIAEESFHASRVHGPGAMDQYANAEWCWAIDPLDGTHNYLNGHHYFAVCLCLMHYGRPVVGVVYRPSNGDCFSATSSTPTMFRNLNGRSAARKIQAPKHGKRLKDGLLITGFATEKGERFDREFEIFKKMMGECRGIRRFGSAALDICYVAQGRWDGFWEKGLAPWDVAAAGLVAQQAGTVVSNYQGQEFRPFDETIVVARRPLYDELIKAF